MGQPREIGREFDPAGTDVGRPRGTTFFRKSGGGIAALGYLVEAYQYAKELHRSPWDFAVEIADLLAAGSTVNGLRWLVCKGYVEHARETTAYVDAARTFQRMAGLRFSKRTCFVLTEEGIAFARTWRAKSVPHDERVEFEPVEPDGRDGPLPKPQWDCQRQELRLGAAVVKRYKVPALNQERVLAAFEEEGWPVRIDDPLPPHPEQDSKRRLHDTITSLNRNQRRPLIRFLGDGSGQGVRWELVGPSGGEHSNGDAEL
jgi:hypothetical protein